MEYFIHRKCVYIRKCIYSTHPKFGNTKSVSALLTRRLTGQVFPVFSRKLTFELSQRKKNLVRE